MEFQDCLFDSLEQNPVQSVGISQEECTLKIKSRHFNFCLIHISFIRNLGNMGVW